ncbi:gephyrin-like molybdotransferase Glp [Caballeronia sp. dw_19]|uniref:molybdopterin molybdotransferase MoeA n=1 Tax=Caballeronia sp. dw_19 TaxID=2719791 RepID=UPI001BD3355C|nr:gephyrin-like molybdotransferase Glp [Caballeronia sp. dw_19]
MISITDENSRTPTVQSQQSLIEADEARQLLLAAVSPLARTEHVMTECAWSRVLAHDIVSDINVPTLDKSAMDGYAIRLADLCGDTTASLPVSQRIPAGQVGQPLLAGTAARIFTGAPIPPGADAVVMQEHCEAVLAPAERAGFGSVLVRVVPPAGESIRLCGEDVQAGSVVLRSGSRLDAAALGLAATIGCAHLDVVARPRVGLFSTGDELVMPGEPLLPGAIYNASRFTLGALLRGLGCIVNDLGNVPDRLDVTRATLRAAARDNDLVLSAGGVSVGEEDHLRPALREEGRLDLWAVAIKPGKPLVFGAVRRPEADPGNSVAGETLYLGLPGNPVSSFVTFLLFVRPVLLRMQGVRDVEPPSLLARADFDWQKPDARREFLRVRRNVNGGLDVYPNQNSSVMTSLAWGDGLADIAPGRVVRAGDSVRYLSLAELAP